jgi:hypothetical protein
MWRSASREECHRYYETEFPNNENDFPPHITANGPKQWALAFHQKYPTIGEENPEKDFIRRGTLYNNGNPVPQFQTFEGVLKFIRAPAEFDPLQQNNSSAALADPTVVDQPVPVPEAVYYGVDSHDHGWPVYLDIDAKDIALEIARNRLPAGSDPETPAEVRRQGGITGEPPKGYPYRFDDIDAAIEYAFELEELLRTELGAEDTLVVYSGQGAHVYLLDDTRKHRYNEHAREALNSIIDELWGIPIDRVVTADRKRVARLPYSLHADVSRVVTPIDDPSFDYRTETVPDVIQEVANNA